MSQTKLVSQFFASLFVILTDNFEIKYEMNLSDRKYLAEQKQWKLTNKSLKESKMKRL